MIKINAVFFQGGQQLEWSSIEEKVFSLKPTFSGLCGEWRGEKKRDLQSYFRKSLKYWRAREDSNPRPRA